MRCVSGVLSQVPLRVLPFFFVDAKSQQFFNTLPRSFVLLSFYTGLLSLLYGLNNESLSFSVHHQAPTVCSFRSPSLRRPFSLGQSDPPKRTYVYLPGPRLTLPFLLLFPHQSSQLTHKFFPSFSWPAHLQNSPLSDRGRFLRHSFHSILSSPFLKPREGANQV